MRKNFSTHVTAIYKQDSAPCYMHKHVSVDYNIITSYGGESTNFELCLKINK